MRSHFIPTQVFMGFGEYTAARRGSLTLLQLGHLDRGPLSRLSPIDPIFRRGGMSWNDDIHLESRYVVRRI